MKVKECSLMNHSEIEMGKSVTDAAKVMKKERSRYVYVTQKKMPMGIISSIDIVDEIVAEGKSPDKAKVQDIMRAPIHACNYDDPIVDVYMKMAKFNLIALPVLKDNKIAGVLTSHEIMKNFAKIGVKKASKPASKSPSKSSKKSK